MTMGEDSLGTRVMRAGDALASPVGPTGRCANPGTVGTPANAETIVKNLTFFMRVQVRRLFMVIAVVRISQPAILFVGAFILRFIRFHTFLLAVIAARQ